MKQKETAVVISQEEISPGIFDLWLKAPAAAAAAVPGQFADLYCRDSSRLLPRPVSICRIDAARGALRLVYRVAGEGTKEFSGYTPGTEVSVIAPLGNGFPLEEAAGRRVLLIGGGIGIPPMLETAAALAGRADVVSILGYRSDCFLRDEFLPFGQVYTATEDGSAGTKGTVLDAIREERISGSVIFACGPKPMLRAVKAYAAETGTACWISMEERMACGIGACLACVCSTTETDPHSQVHNKRVCCDGPVFAASEVEV